MEDKNKLTPHESEGNIPKNAPADASGDEKIDAGDIKVTTKFTKKLENFWYHYKWHTIAALFVTVVAVILIVQLSSRTKYDVYIMYAGDHYFDTTETAGTSSYRETVSSLKRVAEDFDGNGEISISFSNLYIPINNGDESLNDALLKTQDSQTLGDRLTGGEYYVIFISPELYDIYVEDYTEILFVPLAGYEAEGKTYKYYGNAGNAIYLSSTDYYEKIPGISSLPDDTLVVLRTKGAIDSVFSKKQTDKNFARSEEVIRNILAYTKE